MPHLMHDYAPPTVRQPLHKRQAMYIWLDGLQPTANALEDQDTGRGRGAADLGI